MNPSFSQDGITLLLGDCREVMAAMEPESISCVVTSPPFWSLRFYECPPTIWPLAEASNGCEHEWGEEYWVSQKPNTITDRMSASKRQALHSPQGSTCLHCNAWRGWFGLEPRADCMAWATGAAPCNACYLCHTLEVLAAIKRVLRKDGVVWWDIDDSRGSGGDTYKGRKRWQHEGVSRQEADEWQPAPVRQLAMLSKSLALIPERIALTAQAQGWIVRSEIIIPTWMPESARDRPTDAFRRVLMLTRTKRYWYDGFAVRVPVTGSSRDQYDYGRTAKRDDGSGLGVFTGGKTYNETSDGMRSLGSVWDDIGPSNYPARHFATFPIAEAERCILASCPPEICRQCGTARLRVVKRENVREHPQREGRRDRNKADFDGEDYAIRESGLGLAWDDKTVSWTSCPCADYEAGLVLDPFVGTGTTLIAARKLGRRAIGIELSEEYVQQAVTRLTVGDAGVRRIVEAERQGGQQLMMEG